MSNRRKRRTGQLGRTVRLTCTARGTHDRIRLWTIADRRGSVDGARYVGGPVGSGIQVLDEPLDGEHGGLRRSIDENGRTTFSFCCPTCSPTGHVSVQVRIKRLVELLDGEYDKAASTGPLGTIYSDISEWA